MAEQLTLMAVHAHPDDEVFSTGGVLAKAASEGIHTVLVTGTLGDEGEIHDPDLDPDEARPHLAQIREGELRKAVEALGIGELHILGYRDSGMEGTPANADPRNFQNADREEAVGRVVELIRQTRPQVVVTYNERGGYGHPDHIAAHQVTVEAFDAAGDPDRFPGRGGEPWQPLKLYYAQFPLSRLLEWREKARELGLPIPFDDREMDPSQFTVPDDVITTRVDVREWWPQKQSAIRAHRTQIPLDNPLFALPEEIARNIWAIESFTRVLSSVPVPKAEDDLFAGLRSPRNGA